MAGAEFDADDLTVGPAVKAAPKLAADSASSAETPPCRIP